MSTANNNTTTPNNDNIAFIELFNRNRLKDLLISHQHTMDYMHHVANTYNPMIYTLPREITKPTTEEKAALARMLRREKEIMGKIKRLIDAAERDCDELLAELGFGNTWETGWNAGWGTAAAQPDENDDGGNDNAEAN
jgi:hypothetical protein